MTCEVAVPKAPLARSAALVLPLAGDIPVAMNPGEFDGKTYDQTWPERAAKTLR